jgi:16S rRNA G966 N2-methylase RsmD
MSNNYYYAKYQKYKTKYLNLKIKNLYNQFGGMEQPEQDIESATAQSSVERSLPMVKQSQPMVKQSQPMVKCPQLFGYQEMINYYMLNEDKTQKKSIEKIKKKWGQIYGNKFGLELFTNTETNMKTEYNTPFSAREIMKKIISQELEKYGFDTSELTILDANSNIGMDALTFREYFKHVICIEKQEDFFCALQENMKLLKLDNVSIYNDSCLNFLKVGKSFDKSLSAASGHSSASSHQSVDSSFLSTASEHPLVSSIASGHPLASSQQSVDPHTIDVIYFDPPWTDGTQNYRNVGMLSLDGIPMNKIVHDCFSKYKTLKAIYLKFPSHTFLGKPKQDIKISSLFNEVAQQLKLEFITQQIEYSKDSRSYIFNLHCFIRINPKS